MKRPDLSVVCAFLALAANLSGQPQLSFEVASIKPAPPLTPELMSSGKVHLGTQIDGARASYGGASLLNLISSAFRVRTFQINGPDWMQTARFDIQATLPAGASPDQAPEMLQTLLAERFKLVIHRDTKEFPVYALIVGKDGPKLPPRPVDYDPSVKSNIRPMTMANYASILSSTVDKPVVDQTGLQGEYMVTLEPLMKDMTQMLMARAKAMNQARGGGPEEVPAASDPTGSGTFAAIQALGLKLEARKLPLPFLIVGHIEKAPSDN